jgi:hypothetical protein
MPLSVVRCCCMPLPGANCMQLATHCRWCPKGDDFYLQCLPLAAGAGDDTAGAAHAAPEDGCRQGKVGCG